MKRATQGRRVRSPVRAEPSVRSSARGERSARSSVGAERSAFPSVRGEPSAFPSVPGERSAPSSVRGERSAPSSVRGEPSAFPSVRGERSAAKSNHDLRALVSAARNARGRAYAPYSGFRVGAAVLADGHMFVGANVENASYGLTVCAERAAVTAAVLQGARRLDAIAVVSGTSPPTPPCGMCLQTLAEFAGPELPVVLAGARGGARRTTLRELLPHAFSNRYL